MSEDRVCCRTIVTLESMMVDVFNRRLEPLPDQ